MAPLGHCYSYIFELVSISLNSKHYGQQSFSIFEFVRNHIKLLHVSKSRRGFSKGTVLCGGY